MAFEDLAVLVLQQIGAVAVQHAWAPAGDRGGVLGVSSPCPPLQRRTALDALVVEERVEQADRV